MDQQATFTCIDAVETKLKKAVDTSLCTYHAVGGPERVLNSSMLSAQDPNPGETEKCC